MISSAVLSVSALVALSHGAGANVAPQSPGAVQTPSREVDWGLAPDGEKGFGPGRSLREISRLLRSPTDEDRGFVRSLYKLEDDLRVLLSLASERYKEVGYFALLDLAEKEKQQGTGAGSESLSPLERLGAEFRDRAARAGLEIEKGGPAAELLARLLVDARFRARAQVIEGLEFEITDMKAGLAVLSAELDGFAGLRDAEAAAIAQRVDLAAARLRAARLDLEALREEQKDPTAGAAWGKDLETLLALIRSADTEQRAKDLPVVLERLDRREESMEAALFTTRLETKLAAEIEKRAAAVAAAAELLAKVRVYFPGTPESGKADAEIRALSKSRRYAYAGRAAAEALSLDPLNEELNWFAGESSDFLWGSIESRRWFDRFLALRGIRVHEYRTYEGRTLTREEKRAIEAVQAVATTPPSVNPK